MSRVFIPLGHNEDDTKLEILEHICLQAKYCFKCKLHKTRNNVVFGLGDTSSDIVFVGEAPGADEDQQGKPFVGQAGKLLTELIESVGWKRDDVYIFNTVCCRPPNNRKPEPDEIKACKPWFSMQMQMLNPKVIIALGATATETVCGFGAGITRRRGMWEEYIIQTISGARAIPVMPMNHPAALLRNPQLKKLAILDLNTVKQWLKTTINCGAN